jgi:hypothetical protein
VKLKKAILNKSVRIPGFQALWMRFPLGSLHTRMQYDITPYPYYAYGVYGAAMLAKRLGVPAITAIEFGVAGGRGLIALERLAETIEREVGVKIDVVGFDSGQGMPPSTDYRDLPHVWGAGDYQMNEAALRARLTRARLVLGDVGRTVKPTIDAGLAPIGFVAFDLDYYSSTKAAFRVFDGGPATRLPRVYCYFDDIAGPEWACMNEHVGELLAIREFNDAHERQKISQLVNLRLIRPKPVTWNDQIYAFHDFDHPQYTQNVSPRDWAQLPI